MEFKVKYTIKAHPTMYDGVQYRSRLEARWAAFFDLAEWQHEYEPIDLPGWSPDFRVVFPCRHSECEKTDGKRDGRHSLLVEVKPYYRIDQFKGHPCMDYPYGFKHGLEGKTACQIPADASAAFGANPEVTSWEMVHGAGGGGECLESWVSDYSPLWKEAGNIVQWIARGSR